MTLCPYLLGRGRGHDSGAAPPSSRAARDGNEESKQGARQGRVHFRRRGIPCRAAGHAGTAGRLRNSKRLGSDLYGARRTFCDRTQASSTTSDQPAGSSAGAKTLPHVNAGALQKEWSACLQGVQCVLLGSRSKIDRLISPGLPSNEHPVLIHRQHSLQRVMVRVCVGEGELG